MRSLNILAIVQAIIGGLTAVVIFALYGFKPGALQYLGVSLTAAILGAMTLVYFLTIHQILARKHLSLSTLVLTIMTAINLILVIATTGGLDSPYYSLWLLAIVTAGIFGSRQTMVVLVITILYYAYEFVSRGLHVLYMRDHVIQLAITLVAAGLAEWVHSRGRKASAATSQIETLSGQLSTEQFKAEAIISSIGEGVMVVDASRRIQLFNRAAAELTGWDEASAQNIDYNLVLQLKTAKDEALTDINDPINQAWHNGETLVRDDLVTTTRAGRKVQLNLSISPIYDSEQHPSGAIALFRDISKEKEVERQKDEFVSTASHEMRTPVAAIEGYISLAMNPNVATIDDRAKKYLDKAHETIKHLGELFRDLLSVTKAEEGQLTAKMEAVNLGKLMQDATDDMQFTAQKKNLTLVYQIGGQPGKAIAPLFYVSANAERLREVVMNLMDNAIKFTPEGGIKVTLEGNDKEVTVGVSDSGVGIAAEDMPHLFQKFYRIDNTATRTIGGTGLGLYLCRRVVEAFNGRIWVESKPGQGSTFRFTLPRLTQAEAERMIAAVAGSTANPAGAPIPAATGAVVQPAPATTPPAAVPTAAPVITQAPTETAPQTTAIPAAPVPIAMPIPGQEWLGIPQPDETGSATPPQPTPTSVPAIRIDSVTTRRRIQ